MERVGQVYRHLTALSPLQERILELLGFSSRVYRRLCTVSHEPLWECAKRKSIADTFHFPFLVYSTWEIPKSAVTPGKYGQQPPCEYAW